MSFFNRKNKLPWDLKKYLYIANDITSALLNKEKEKADKRVQNLSIVLLILAVILVISFVYNVYLITL